MAGYGEAVYDAVVLAGGAARRLGGADKPGVEVGGVTLLQRTVAAVGDAATLVVVGPPRRIDGATVVWCREQPPGGGPVAALAAGLPATSATLVVVLAADLPWVAPAVPRLVAAVPADGVAVLADADGRVNYLAAAWQRSALVAALARVQPTGAAVRQLLAAVPTVLVADQGAGRDCDTWSDITRARADLASPTTRSSPA